MNRIKDKEKHNSTKIKPMSWLKYLTIMDGGRVENNIISQWGGVKSYEGDKMNVWKDDDSKNRCVIWNLES